MIDKLSPVVTIAAGDGMRGKPIGRLLRALVDGAAARSVRLPLDAREPSAAMRLYEPVGFRRVRGQEVRGGVGTMSFGMVHGEGAADP